MLQLRSWITKDGTSYEVVFPNDIMRLLFQMSGLYLKGEDEPVYIQGVSHEGRYKDGKYYLDQITVKGTHG